MWIAVGIGIVIGAIALWYIVTKWFIKQFWKNG